MFKKMNQKGFTLIELLIVVAIIAILAAIAIPQFAQYRVRGYNASANTDLRNIRTSEESLFADWQRYGASELAALPGSGGAAGAQITGPGTPLAPPILTLTDSVAAPRGIQVALGNNVTFHALTDVAWGSYVMVSKHMSGDTAYAADSDSTSNYRQTNTAWITQAVDTNTPPPASTAGVVNLAAPWLAM